MFSVFLKGHLLTKKFFTFLIGSTFLSTKIKSYHFRDHFVNKKDNSEVEIKHLKEITYNTNMTIPEYIYDYNERKHENMFPKNNLRFLIKNICLSVKNIFYFLALFGRTPIAYCEIPKFKKPYLGCSIRANEDGKGMKIVMIKSDSPAEKAGLKVKDIIKEIDSKPVRTINEYNAAVGSEANKKQLKILRMEGEKENVFEVYVDFIYSE